MKVTTKGEGDKNTQNFVHVVYGCPLSVTLTKIPQFPTYAILLTLKKTRRSVQESLDKKKKLQKIKRSMKNVTFVKLMSLGLFPNFFFVHQTLFNCGCHLGKTSKLPFFPGLIPPDIRVGPQRDDHR